MDRVAKLKQAARIIAEVEATLNLKHSACLGCGGTRYENWTDYGIKERLQAARQRIEKAADEFDRKGMSNPLLDCP